jgi:tetratricopeptide (TPR) repeat protein
VTSPNSKNPEAQKGSPSEALRALRRGLVRADGFALFISIFKTPAQRDQLIANLRETLPNTKVVTIVIRPYSNDILDDVLGLTGGDIRGPIMIVGLENAVSTDAPPSPILTSLNLRRPDWPRLIRHPVVFWIPEHLFGILSRTAPDFLDWRSDTFEFPSTETPDFPLGSRSSFENTRNSQMPLNARTERIKELESLISTNETSTDPVVLRSVADWLNQLGGELDLLGKPKESLNRFRKSLSLARKLRDRDLESIALGNLGIIWDHLGKTKTALQFFQHSLEISRELGSRVGEMAGLGNLGVVYARIGDTRRARESFEKVLSLAREAGDKRREADSLGHIGNVYQQLGDERQAIYYYDRALELHKLIGNTRGEDIVLGNLASAYMQANDIPTAIRFYEERLSFAREFGYRSNEATILNNLANAYLHLGDIRRAEAVCRSSWEIQKEIGDKFGQANALGLLGNIFAAMGDSEKAIEVYNLSAKLAREINFRRGEAVSKWNAATEYWKIDKHIDAIALGESALILLETIKDPLRTKARAALERWRGQK